MISMKHDSISVNLIHIRRDLNLNNSSCIMQTANNSASIYRLASRISGNTIRHSSTFLIDSSYFHFHLKLTNSTLASQFYISLVIYINTFCTFRKRKHVASNQNQGLIAFCTNNVKMHIKLQGKGK
jgi:hypothetical protein